MPIAHRRHDISDHIWSLLEPHLPGRVGSWGGVATDNRLYYQCHFLDSSHRRTLARFATRLG